jgi:predicted DNA-binding protein (UPF0251 family)
VKHVTCKYPDVALAKALSAALKVSEADPYRAQIVWQRACDLVRSRGTTASINGGGGGVSAITVAHLGPEAEQRQGAIDAAHWILSSALSIGTMAADFREGLAAVARFFDVGRTRRPPLKPKVHDLTNPQIEAMTVFAECKGSYADAARRLGIDRKSFKERHDAACKKLGKMAVKKPKTKRQPHDKRGQLKIASQDDGPATILPPDRVLRDRRLD